MKTAEIKEVKDVKTVADVSLLLRYMFRLTGYSTITDWLKDLRIRLPHETAASIILRQRRCGLKSFLELAISFNMPSNDIAWILRNIYEDDIIWRRIQDSELGIEDQAILSALNNLPEQSREAIINMIKSMGGTI